MRFPDRGRSRSASPGLAPDDVPVRPPPFANRGAAAALAVPPMVLPTLATLRGRRPPRSVRPSAMRPSRGFPRRSPERGGLGAGLVAAARLVRARRRASTEREVAR